MLGWGEKEKSEKARPFFFFFITPPPSSGGGLLWNRGRSRLLCASPWMELSLSIPRAHGCCGLLLGAAGASRAAGRVLPSSGPGPSVRQHAREPVVARTARRPLDGKRCAPSAQPCMLCAQTRPYPLSLRSNFKIGALWLVRSRWMESIYFSLF